MTGDEMERAIEFLLQSQANSEARLAKTEQQIAQVSEQLAQTNEQLAQTNEQLAQTNEQVALFTETQTQFMQTMLGHVEAQGEFNAGMRQGMRSLSEAQEQTQRDISELTRVVHNLVNFISGNGDRSQE